MNSEKKHVELSNELHFNNCHNCGVVEVLTNSILDEVRLTEDEKELLIEMDYSYLCLVVPDTLLDKLKDEEDLIQVVNQKPCISIYCYFEKLEMAQENFLKEVPLQFELKTQQKLFKINKHDKTLILIGGDGHIISSFSEMKWEMKCLPEEFIAKIHDAIHIQNNQLKKDVINHQPNIYFLLGIKVDESLDCLFSRKIDTLKQQNDYFNSLCQASNNHDFFKQIVPTVSKKTAKKLPVFFFETNNTDMQNKKKTATYNMSLELAYLSVFSKPETINNLIGFVTKVNRSFDFASISISTIPILQLFVFREEYEEITLTALDFRKVISEIIPLEKLDFHLNKLLFQQDFQQGSFVKNELKRLEKITSFFHFLKDSFVLYTLLKEEKEKLENRLKLTENHFLAARLEEIIDTIENADFKNISEAHDALSLTYSNISSDSYSFDENGDKKIDIYYKDLGISFKTPKDTSELIKYGTNDLSNCVASYNNKLHYRNDLQIVFVVDENDKAIFCIEIRCTQTENFIVQAKKRHNRILSDSPKDDLLKEGLRRFLKDLNQEKETTIRTSDLASFFENNHS